MTSFARLLAAGPLYFLSAWLLMIFAGITSGDMGIRPIGYETAMVATIGLWLVIAPAVGAVARRDTKRIGPRKGRAKAGQVVG